MNHYKLTYQELINELFWFTVDIMSDNKIDLEIEKLKKIEENFKKLSTGCPFDENDN
jgi:hypothetical protein